MKIISHRGNLNGRIPFEENRPEYILSAIRSGYDTEIDLWRIRGKLFLGHDQPNHLIDLKFLIKYQSKIWIHCKNLAALSYLNCMKNKILNYFWHENDTYTLTSKGYIWTYPNKTTDKNCIIVLNGTNHPPKCFGICSDFPVKYKK